MTPKDRARLRAKAERMKEYAAEKRALKFATVNVKCDELIELLDEVDTGRDVARSG